MLWMTASVGATERLNVVLFLVDESLGRVLDKIDELGLTDNTPMRRWVAVYHGIGWRSRKKPPLGPSSGRVASHTMVSAPCSTERSASGPPMSVRTQPGQTELILTPDSLSSSARMRVRALSAVLEKR